MSRRSNGTNGEYAGDHVLPHIDRVIEPFRAGDAYDGPPPRPEPPNGKPRSEPVLTRASSLKPRAIEWVWQWWIPRGALTVIDADPGIGKSTLTLDIAARLSRGDPMPTGPLVRTPPAATLLLCEEDDPDNTVRPRLDAAGADVDRVHLFSCVRVGGQEVPVTIPWHLELVEEAARALGIAMVVIDPIMAYLGSEFDAHKDQDIRRCLRVLAAFARRTGMAVVMVRHLNKLSGGDPMYRGGGSIGIIGAARCGHVVGYDPADDTRLVIACNKSNLGPKPRSVAWRFEAASEGIARVVWDGECDLKPRDVLGRGGPPGRPPAQVQEAMDWLGRELAGGPRAAADLISEAEAAGIAERTLRRAKAELRVVTEKRFAGWFWGLGGQGCQNSQPHSNSGSLDPGGARPGGQSADGPRIYDDIPE